jgi:hypothetical protein
MFQTSGWHIREGYGTRRTLFCEILVFMGIFVAIFVANFIFMTPQPIFNLGGCLDFWLEHGLFKGTVAYTRM